MTETCLRPTEFSSGDSDAVRPTVDSGLCSLLARGTRGETLVNATPSADDSAAEFAKLGHEFWRLVNLPSAHKHQ